MQIYLIYGFQKTDTTMHDQTDIYNRIFKLNNNPKPTQNKSQISLKELGLLLTLQ